MDPSFHDPNNHVPEVAPADTWDDTNKDVPVVPIVPRVRQVVEKQPAIREESEASPSPKVDSEEVPDPDLDVCRLEVSTGLPKMKHGPASSLPKIVLHPASAQAAVPEVSSPPFEAGAEEFGKWGNDKRVPVGWIVISGIALTILFVAGVLWLPKFEWSGEGSASDPYSRIHVDTTQQAPEVGKDAGFAAGYEDEADQVVKAYATATSLEKVLLLVRDRARVEPAMRSRWRSLGLPSDWRIPDSSQWDLGKAGKREFGVMSGFLPDLTPFRFFVIREGTGIVVDWEATTGFSETSFDDLGMGRGSGGVTRGSISPGYLYTVSLPEKRFQCYRIISPDGQVAIWGYVRRDDPVARTLAGLFNEGMIVKETFEERFITVHLDNPPPDSLSNQWLIAEMLHIDWITP